MQFFALVSITFYIQVMLSYDIPTTLPIRSSRGVAMRSMKGKNFYTPMVIVKAVNQVKGVNVKFIVHRDSQHPYYVDWDQVLKKHFNQFLTRYTFNYFFKFGGPHEHEIVEFGARQFGYVRPTDQGIKSRLD
jgi:hypothetical protein